MESAETAGNTRLQDLRDARTKALDSLKAARVASQDANPDYWTKESADHLIKIGELNVQIPELEANLGKITGERGMLAGQVTTLSDTLDDLQANDLDQCSKCGQKVDASHIEAEIEKTQGELEAAQELKAEADIQSSTLTESLRAAKAVRDEHTSRREVANINAVAAAGAEEAVTQAQVALNSVTEKGMAVKAQLDQDKITLAETLRQAQEDHDAGQQARAAATLERDEYRTTEAAAQEEVAKAGDLLAIANVALAGHVQNRALAQSQLDTANVNLKKLVTAQEDALEREVLVGRWIAACNLLDPKTGLPIYLVDMQIPYLEQKINEYMTELGMPELVVEMVTQAGEQETLEILINDGEEEKLDIRAYSGGQLGRVEMAVKQALCDLAEATRGIRLELLCLDEPTDGLDDAGKAALIQLVHRRCQERFPVTLIVSHDERLMASFDKRMDVEKAADGSTALNTGMPMPVVKKAPAKKKKKAAKKKTKPLQTV